MDVGMKLGLANGLGPAQRSALWLVLKHYNDGTGFCCPKIETLAAAEGIGYSAMAKTLVRLMKNSCFERRMVGVLYHYDLPPAIASTIVAKKTAYEAGVIFDIESHYRSEIDRLGTANNRPHFGSIEHLSSGHGVHDSGHGVHDSGHGVHDSGHGARSERSKKGFIKEVRKELVSSTHFANRRDDKQDTKPAPKPALVPVAAITSPATAEAVYNTLIFPTDPDSQEDDMDDLTRARAAALLQRQDEIELQLRDGTITDPDEWQQRREEMQDIKRLRLQLEALLSDEGWRARAATAADTRSERLVEILADLINRRWADFPYRIDWPRRLAQLIQAYRAAGRRGHDLLDDLLTASASADKDLALMLLMSRLLSQEETIDDRIETDVLIDYEGFRGKGQENVSRRTGGCERNDPEGHWQQEATGPS